MSGLAERIIELERRLDAIHSIEAGGLLYLDAPLTSASWDGDPRSTTAKTVIDLSAVFGVPANAKAILARVAVRDSGSAGGLAEFILGPNNTADLGMYVSCSGLTNDAISNGCLTVLCDANGDVYYQAIATGAGTLDVWLQIWGYWL